MKRELAFALQTQFQLTGSLGRTRASSDLTQRSSKRFKGGGVNESESNGEIDGPQEKSEINGSIDQNQEKKGSAVRGMIKDVGILCFCSSCKGSRVVNPCQFEIHACKSYRRAAQYICLENGKSLLQVVKACRNSPLEMLEETIQSVIGPLPKKKSIICQNCEGPFLATFAEKVEQLCQSCVGLKISEATPTHSTETNSRSVKLVLALRKSSRSAKTGIL